MGTPSDNIFRRLYSAVLKEQPGEGVRQFFRHLSWIGGSFAAAKVISSLVNIAAGRALGPQEYGKINVMVSVGTIISTFLLAGNHVSAVKYGVDAERRDKVFSTVAVASLAMGTAVLSLTFFFRSELCVFFGIDSGMLLLAASYAAATSAFMLASGMQQARGDFHERGLSEVAFSLILAASFILSLTMSGRVYKAMAYAYITAFGTMAALWLYRMAGHIRFALAGMENFRRISAYSMYSFGSSLSACLGFSVQSLMVNAYLPARDVGIYAAYYTITIGAAGYLVYAATTVLFPKASASTNRRRLWDLAAGAMKFLAPASFICLLVLETAVLALMGRHQYGMNAALMLLFAASGTLIMIQNLLGQIVASEGVRASRLSLFISAGSGISNFLLCLLLIPRLGVAGVPSAFILTSLWTLLWLYKAKDPYLA